MSICFSGLHLVSNGPVFFSLSVLLRTLTVCGCYTVTSSSFPLGQAEVSPQHVGKMMGALECCMTVGTMLGLALGGLLYDAGGFYLPPLAVGGAALVVGGLATLLLRPGPGHQDQGTEGYQELGQDEEREQSTTQSVEGGDDERKN